MNIKKKRMENKGFTLGEIVVTVAIVGAITAIAVPNYMRIRMNTNVEMVRQHLRKMGQDLNDYNAKNKQFPQSLQGLGNSSEEASITANLSAIDLLGYTTDDYRPASGLGNYEFHTCPKPGEFGKAGDKCFILTPLGITEEAAPNQGGGAFGLSYDPWDTSGIGTVVVGSAWYAELGTAIYSDSQLSHENKVNLMAGLFETYAYNLSGYKEFCLQHANECDSYFPSNWQNELFSVDINVPKANSDDFHDLVREAAAKVIKKGIKVFFSLDDDSLPGVSRTVSYPDKNSYRMAFQIGEGSTTTWDELQQSPDVQALQTYDYTPSG